MTSSRERWHRWARPAVGLAVSAAFLAATFSRVDYAVIAEVWATTTVGLLALAILISSAEVAVRALRWLILLKPIAEVRYRTALAYLSIGHLGNAVLPARLGDVARAFLAGGRLKASRVSVLGTIVVERVADAGLLGIAAAGGILLGYSHLAPVLALLVLAGVLCTAVVLVAAVAFGRRTVAATRVGALVRHHAMRLATGAASLRRLDALAAVGALTVVSFGLAVALMLTVASAVGLSMEVWQASVIIAAVTLSTAIPAGPASLGTYEFVGVSVMASMGYPVEASLVAVGVVHTIATVVPAAMGLASMWSMNIRSFAPLHAERRDEARPEQVNLRAAHPVRRVAADVELSVIVPAHNSGPLIDETIARLSERLSGTSAEIIVVENASTDDTFARCIALAAESSTPGVQLSVLQSDRGIGNALRAGVLASRGASVLLTADDLPFGFDDLDGADHLARTDGRPPPAVIGSKTHRDSVVDRGLMRESLTWGYGLMRRLVLGMRTGDPQGTFLIDGDLARQLIHHAVEPGFLFTTELALILERVGIRPTEVPVTLRMDHRDHSSRVSTSDALGMAIGLMRLRRRHRGRWQTRSVSVERPTVTR